MEAPELLQVVTEQERLVGQLERDLEPRRSAEARELAALTARRDTARAAVAAAERRNAAASLATEARAAELRGLQEGLSRARRMWVRVFFPMLAAFLLLLALLALGFARWTLWWAVASLAVAGFLLGRQPGARRG